MASRSSPIYNIWQGYCVYSTSGKLRIAFVSSGVAIIFIFIGNTIVIEHRTDIELCENGKSDKVFDLFVSIL